MEIESWDVYVNVKQYEYVLKGNDGIKISSRVFITMFRF